MRTLLLDIETSPNTVHVWGLFKQDISINQIIESSYVLCWAAKWLGDSGVIYERTANPLKGSSRGMIKRIHKLVHRADCVVHYNGSQFDMPTLNKEFILHGLPVPAPYRQVDLLRVTQQQFRFTSSKLDYVAQALGLGHKIRHEGHLLWVKCMNGNEEAWRRMKEYNTQDVTLLEKLYHRLLPWIKSTPNQALYLGGSCPRCGENSYQKRGHAYTTLGRYPRYKCKRCKGWFRGTTSTLPKGKKMVVI